MKMILSYVMKEEFVFCVVLSRVPFVAPSRK